MYFVLKESLSKGLVFNVAGVNMVAKPCEKCSLAKELTFQRSGRPYTLVVVVKLT